MNAGSGPEGVGPRTDVHQHLWPTGFVDALRARRTPPFLDGWTLFTAGEPPYPVRARDHDVAARAALVAADGLDRAFVSLSSPLGVEYLPDGGALLDAFHDGALRLGAPFAVWAAANVVSPDPGAVRSVLASGAVGLQLPATALADEAGIDRCAPLFDELARAGLPLLVHPGPAPDSHRPPWWPATVSYVGQLHAAWFAWHAHACPRYADLPVVFAACAGLAPLHVSRSRARGGPAAHGARSYVDTSSYDVATVSAVAREIGWDHVLLGSDRPYAEPIAPDGPLADRVRRVNPHSVWPRTPVPRTPRTTL